VTELLLLLLLVSLSKLRSVKSVPQEEEKDRRWGRRKRPGCTRVAVHVVKKLCRCFRAGFGEGTDGVGGQATRTIVPRTRVERNIAKGA